MADLIELDLVVRDKTLKASISTVARLEREIIKAQKAVDSNTISQARYNKVLLSAKREYQALGVSSQKATAQVRNFAAAQAQASKATNSFAAGLGLSGKGINRLGVGMQQAGYQVGDFAVQLQGGTNAAVALGQQGSQLLGIFGPAGAIAGAGLAIATAFIAPMIKAKESADQVGVSIDAVFDRIVARSGSIGKLLEVTFSGPLELARQRFLGIEGVFKRLDEKTLLDKLGAEASEYNVVLQELNNTFAENEKLIKQKAKRTGGLSGIALSEEELKNLKDAQKAIVTFQADLGIAMRGPTEDIAKGFVEAYTTLQDMSSVVAESIGPEFKRLLEDTGLYAQYQEELLQAAEEQNQKDRERAQSQAEFAANAISAGNAAISAEEAILKAYNEKLQALWDVAYLNGTILQSENDQEAVLRAKQDIQRRSLSVYIDEADLTEEQTANLLNALATIQEQERELLKVAQNTADAKEEAKLFAEAMKDVLSAMSQIDSFGLSLKDKLAKITASNEAIKQGLDGQIAGEIQLLKIQRARLTLGLDRDDILAKSTELRQIDDTIAAYEEQLKLNKKLTKSNKTGTKSVKDNRTAYEKAMMTAKEFADTLDQQVISAVDGVSNAFSDFLQRGMKDFKGFVKSIGDMFLKLLADMAAAALKRQILIPIATGMAAGFGSAAAGASMGQYATGGAQAGTIGASIAAGASNFGSAALHTITGGTAGSVAAGSTMASIGAVAPYILAVVAVIGLFTKKVKLLDSGLRTTVEGFDVAIETFKKTQTSRLFGLLKGSKKTSYEAASAEVADPLIEAIGNMQQSIVDAAGTLGIGADAFDDFSYQFKLSLKGLSEEEQLQKINEEITKMGDSFASLTGHFETMNELLAVAQQRYDLNTRLLQLQGNTEELLQRQREAEMEATHELNKGLLQSIYALEDSAIAANKARVALDEANAALSELEAALSKANSAYEEASRGVESAASAVRQIMQEASAAAQQAVDDAYDTLRDAMDRAMSAAVDAVDDAYGTLRDAMDRAMSAAVDAVDSAQADLERSVEARVQNINKSFDSILDNLNSKLDIASQKANASRGIFELLDSSLRGRRVSSEATSFASRQQALSYVSSGGTDMDKLSDALGVLNEPSEKFFGTFQEYARDFAATSNAIRGSRDAAEATMDADEKAVALLEEQISQNEASRDLQIQQVEALLGTEEAALSVAEAVVALEAALADKTTIENQHKELVSQFPLLSEDVVSVASAVVALEDSLADKHTIEAQHSELIAQFPLLSEDVVSVTSAVDTLNAALADKETIASQHEELIAQFPILNESVLSIGQAINNLASAQAAQAAAAKVQAAAAAKVTTQQTVVTAAEKTVTAADSNTAAVIARQVADEARQRAEAAAAKVVAARERVEAANQKVAETAAAAQAAKDKVNATLAAMGRPPMYAQGGYHTGGLRMVGERGPELEATGPSRIFSHNQTSGMFKDPDLKEAVNELRREVSGLRSEQRQMQASNAKYVKRNYDINRKWDVDGLPATRT